MTDKEEVQFYKNNFLLDNDASFAPFGYAFQADAGLHLFCFYYKEIESIKIESKLQDIEIKRKDGNYILAQAKASQNPFDCPSHGNKLNDALFSLSKHYTSKDDRLIYVTNIDNPFGDEMRGQFNDTFRSFSELSPKAQKMIKERISLLKEKIGKFINEKSLDQKKKQKIQLILGKMEQFPFDNLTILSISRYCSDDQRESIKDRMAKLLVNDFNMPSQKVSSVVDRLFSIWHELFFLNSEKIDSLSDKSITKEQFCWPIITISSLERSPDEICDYFDGQYDESLGSEIKHCTESFVRQYDYELINEVLNDYNAFSPTDPAKKSKEYILSNWKKYSVYFENVNPQVTKGSSMFFLYGLLSDRIHVQRVIRGKDL